MIVVDPEAAVIVTEADPEDPEEAETAIKAGGEIAEIELTVMTDLAVVIDLTVWTDQTEWTTTTVLTIPEAGEIGSKPVLQKNSSWFIPW